MHLRFGLLRFSPMAVLWTFSAPFFLSAESAPKSLDDCYQAALARSEAILIQGETLQQAAERHAQALAALLPNVQASGFALLRGPFYAAESPVNPAYASADVQNAKITLTQPLFRGLAEFAAIRQAKATVEGQRSARLWAGMQLYADVTSAFYNVLALENDRTLLKEQDKAYTSRIQDLAGRVAIGRSRSSEVSTLEAARAQLAAQTVAVEANLQIARDLLAYLTGLDPSVQIARPGVDAFSWRVEPLAQFLEDAARRPDVVASAKLRDAARENPAIARAAGWPSVNLGGEVIFNRTASSSLDLAWGAQVGLVIPIFSGGLVEAKVRESESQARQAELQYQQVKRLAENTVASLWRTVASDAKQLDALKRAVDLSKKAYNELLNDYNFSLSTTQDVLTAFLSYQVLARSWDSARFNYESDRTRLEVLSGRRMDLLKQLDALPGKAR